MHDFRIEVEVPSHLNEQHHKGIEEAIGHCLVHNTLLHPPKITLQVSTMVSFA